MENFVGALQTGLSASNMWSNVAPVAPFIIGLVLFAMAYSLVKRNTRRAKNPTKGGTL